MTTSGPRGSNALLAIIGGGNMARAIILGALDARLLSPGEIVVVEPDASKRSTFAAWGVAAVADHHDALARLAPVPTDLPGGLSGARVAEGLGALGGQVVLAVKPQSLGDVARVIGPALAASPRVVVSILAGTPIATLAAAFAGCPIVRAMPNTPARLRKGMTALSAAPGTTPAHSALAYDLFASLGEVVRIDERLMDAYTALAGSGPAYVFYLAEALLSAAAEAGFDRITADRVVRQTLAGSAALLGESSEPPEALRAAVTSKGGTTEAAIGVLESRQVRRALVDAVLAGRDRGAELARSTGTAPPR